MLGKLFTLPFTGNRFLLWKPPILSYTRTDTNTDRHTELQKRPSAMKLQYGSQLSSTRIRNGCFALSNMILYSSPKLRDITDLRAELAHEISRLKDVMLYDSAYLHSQDGKEEEG